jgi:hypothetical protein
MPNDIVQYSIDRLISYFRDLGIENDNQVVIRVNSLKKSMNLRSANSISEKPHAFDNDEVLESQNSIDQYPSHPVSKEKYRTIASSMLI